MDLPEILDQIPLLLLSCVVGVIAAVIPAIWMSRRRDAREPPSIPSTIPVIGHVINLIRHSNSYYTYLHQKYPDLPCFTLRLFSVKAYVINTPELVAAVHRNTKDFTFDPLLENSAWLLGGISKDGLKKHRAPGVSAKLMKQMHPQMLPGPALDAMNRSMVRDIADSVNKRVVSADTEVEIDLWRWVRETVGLASTNSVCGRELNPYADPSNFKAFETYEQSLMQLWTGLGRLIARDGYKSREQLVKAYLDYTDKGGLDTAAPM